MPRGQSTKVSPLTGLEKVRLWLLFNVFVAFLPFLFDAIAADKNNVLGQLRLLLNSLLSKREVYIVCTGIAADALGSLAAVTTQDNRGLRHVLVGGCALILCVTCFAFALHVSDSYFTAIVLAGTLLFAGYSKYIS